MTRSGHGDGTERNAPLVHVLRQEPDVDMTIRVLVADDEAPVRALLGIALGMDEDFTVVGEACDGYQAIELARTRHPDAVVLDLLMPNMGGMQAVPVIRQACPDTKIVVFSALAESQMADEAIASGADAYLEKTKFVSELSNTLHRLCPVA
jgi:DNA-binding NarL/FixJ family response regulator